MLKVLMPWMLHSPRLTFPGSIHLWRYVKGLRRFSYGAAIHHGKFKWRRSLAAKGFTATPLRSYPSTRSLMRRTLTEPPPAYSRTAEVYGSFFWSKACKAIKNRADAVLLAHLRAGHTPLLIEYTNFLNSSVDPSCPLCQ